METKQTSSKKFGAVQGVHRTRVGYTGGRSLDPTYHDMGDHTESIQVDFDPSAVSYDHLLDLFWEAHNPFVSGWGTQYAHKLWYHNEDQKRAIEGSVSRLRATHGGKVVVTSISPLGVWYNAEDYHQKYYLRHKKSLVSALGLPDEAAALRDSPYAARLNSWCEGQGLAKMREELATWSLPQASIDVIVASLDGSSGKRVIKCGM